MFEELTKLLDKFITLGVPGNDCIVMLHGKEVYRRQSGFSDRENGIKMQGNELFNLYSCSKPITSVCAMQLVEKGIISLDDKLSDYIPEFSDMQVKMPDGSVQKAKNPILIRHLLSMTAGFDYSHKKLETENTVHNADIPETLQCVKRLADYPLEFEPGTKWKYSLCLDVMAGVIEAVTGKKFADYVKENVFDVLGMASSTFLLPTERLCEIAPQYKFFAEEGIAKRIDSSLPNYKTGSRYSSGGGGLISTVNDYIKFLEELRCGEKLLKRESIAEMTKNQLSPEALESYAYHERYGYGFGMRTPKNGVTFDYGWGGMAGSWLAVSEELGYTVFYAQHLLSAPNATIRGRIANILASEFKK